MTLDDLREFAARVGDADRARRIAAGRVYELGPNTQGIAALMMLNLMETVPARRVRASTAPTALHVMIEAKKLAYADMLRYVGRSAFRARAGRGAMLDKARAAERARLIDTTRAACKVEPSTSRAASPTAQGGDTIYLSVIDTATATSSR